MHEQSLDAPACATRQGCTVPRVPPSRVENAAGGRGAALHEGSVMRSKQARSLHAPHLGPRLPHGKAFGLRSGWIP
eukprot:352329-Chlamydomonas_euryale.AAC.2